jgi:hypothetical protein
VFCEKTHFLSNESPPGAGFGSLRPAFMKALAGCRGPRPQAMITLRP